MQKPPAPKGEVCPFNGKDVSRVCHKCPLYVQVRGTNANTGAEVDHWGCSFAFLPMMLIENTQMERQTGAAVESLRNVVAAARTEQRAPYVAQVQHLRPEPKALSEH
jgi:hypothetical protein